MPKKKNARRKDGLIKISVYVGRDAQGKRMYRYVYGKSQKDAEEKALSVKLSLRKGLDVAAARDTFSFWADRFLEGKERTVSNGQYTSYTASVKHLAPLCSMEIGRIRPDDVQSILNQLSVRNPYTGKPAAAKTLIVIRMTASQIFRLAISNRVIDLNPADALYIPRTAPAQKRGALTQEEQQRINDTPHRAQTAAMIMLYAGLRRGELVALQWSDIDLDARTITVNKSAEALRSRYVIKPSGKTDAAMRVVYIPQRLVEYLRTVPRVCDYVCHNARGQMHSPTSFYAMWESYLGELNRRYGAEKNINKHMPKKLPFTIPRFTPHWLRHTCATNMYLAGIDPLTAKDQLGHASIQTTLSIYTHLDQKYKRRAIDKLDEYFSHAGNMRVDDTG